MIERVEKESGNVPEVAKTDMRKYPWEVVLLDGWAVPEHPGVDMRPRKFRDELVAILVATRWNRNGPFRHVVRPRKTWDTTKCDYSDNTISEI